MPITRLDAGRVASDLLSQAEEDLTKMQGLFGVTETTIELKIRLANAYINYSNRTYQ